MNLEQIKNMLEKFSLLNVNNVAGYENETEILARIIFKIRYIFQNFKMIEGLINPKLRYGDYYNERLRYLECLEYGKYVVLK